MERTTWAWMPAVVLLLSWGVAPWCAAQPPVPPSTMPPGTNPLAPASTGPSVPSPRPMMSPNTGPGAGQGRANLPQALPLSPTSPAFAGRSAVVPPGSPLEGHLNLKTAPLEPTDLRFPINLATALRLSDARPLIVAAARAGVWVAEAQLMRAKVLWIPTLNIGFDYIRHDGGGPDLDEAASPRD
ncbi:MAG: hypothetical protein ACP5XB_26605 [Isosphaeraceae bacterium]